MAFKIGHLKYSSKGDFQKGHLTWNAGTSVWIECKCIVCGEDFKIREYQFKRGRGKYCSKKCFYKSITIYPTSPTEKLVHQFRLLDEYSKWRMDCLKRDYFSCQECFIKDSLEVHHIKSLTELVIEFLKEYDQFSPIEDRETLLRLAVKYKPFWDLNNGKTLCESHHKSLRKILWQ